MCTNCMVDVVTSGAYEGDDPLNSDSDEDADGKQFRRVQRVKPSDAVTARAEHECMNARFLLSLNYE
jgi:hypothetical protein